MGGTMGTMGMSDYTNPMMTGMGMMPNMAGSGLLGSGSMMNPNSASAPTNIPMSGNAVAQGRKLELKGVDSSLSLEMVEKYFNKFGQVQDCGLDTEEKSGFIVFSQPYMLNYCAKKAQHVINGVTLTVEKSKGFDNVNNMDVD